MKTNTLKGISLIASLLAGMGASSLALATSTDVQSLASGTNPRIDAWTFNCPATHPRGRATVQDNPAPNDPLNLLQVVLGRAGFASNQVTDSKPFPTGEGGSPSAPAVVNGGAGLYVAVFKKTSLGGVESYTGDLYCVNSSNARINPVIKRQINQ
jgi:hypothetical protein